MCLFVIYVTFVTYVIYVMFVILALLLDFLAMTKGDILNELFCEVCHHFKVA